MATSGYRRLLRSASSAFRSDAYALSQAKITLRNEFLKHRVVPNAEELRALLRGIEEVDEMLRFNIVQGRLNDKGHYAVKLESPEHQTVLEQGKNDPHGVDIAPMDSSVLGAKGVQVTKTKSTKIKGEGDQQ